MLWQPSSARPAMPPTSMPGMEPKWFLGMTVQAFVLPAVAFTQVLLISSVHPCWLFIFWWENLLPSSPAWTISLASFLQSGQYQSSSGMLSNGGSRHHMWVVHSHCSQNSCLSSSSFLPTDGTTTLLALLFDITLSLFATFNLGEVTFHFLGQFWAKLSNFLNVISWSDALFPLSSLNFSGSSSIRASSSYWASRCCCSRPSWPSRRCQQSLPIWYGNPTGDRHFSIFLPKRRRCCFLDLVLTALKTFSLNSRTSIALGHIFDLNGSVNS